MNSRDAQELQAKELPAGATKPDDTPARATPLIVLAFPRQSGNPYHELLYAAVEAHGVRVRPGSWHALVHEQYDLVHYHWPEAFLNLPSRWQRWVGFVKCIGRIAAAKLRGKACVWTMHDAAAHEEHGGMLPHLFRMFTLGTWDGLIALSAVSAAIMLARYPVLRHKPLLHSRHGSYRARYPHLPTKAAAKMRAGFAPDTLIIGYLGAIRPYKNLPHLLRVFQQLPDPTYRLMVAGQCVDEALTQELTTLAQADARIHLTLGFVPDEEVVWHLRAMDLVVAPFREILNSGSSLLALSLNLPILVPAKGTLLEVAAEVGPTWMRTYPATLTPEILADALQWAAQPRAGSAPLDRYDWAECGRETAAFFREIAHSD